MRKVAALFGAIFLAFSLTAWSQQQESGTIVGTVTDSTGAVIPNAKVTVSSPDIGISRDFNSNSAGAYTAASLPIGTYTVSAEAPGFQKLVHSGITMQVGQTQRVDLQLSVGQITQEVHVSASVVQVQTESAALSGVVTGKQIADLELNGRNFVTLALMIPGAAPDNGLDTSHVGVYGNNNISFNGNRMQYNNWEIDGGNNTDEGSAGTFNTYPNLDTIAEFRISTSNYGADMGKHGGANIQVATKSGTKTFHGIASEYNRNSAAAANDFFLNRDNQPKGFLNQNEYGYTFGGPFYIPGHYNTAKDKTFFYWSEDWRSIRQGQTIGNNVPTSAMRTGDFSEAHWPGYTGPNDPGSPNFVKQIASDGGTLPALTAAGGPCNRGASIYKNSDGTLNKDYDPTKANCIFYDNIAQLQAATVGLMGITQASLNQAFANGTALLNGLVPLQNTNVAGHWNTASPAATNWRQEQIRVDQNLGDKTRVFVRYTQDAWNTVAIPALWNWASYDTIKTPFGGPGKSAVLDITHSFKPNLMNEFTAAYTTDHIVLTNLAADSVAGSINRPSGFVMNHLFAANNSNPLLPSLELCGGLNFCTNEDAGNRPWTNSNPIITWKDNLAWTHGNHTTKMGFYLENYRKSEQFGFNTQGALYNGAGGTLTTGNAMADMFLGRIQQYQEGTQTFNGVPVGGYPKGHWQMTDLEPYIQDDWKVTKKLTLNLGLRYYYYSRIHDVSRPTVDSGFLPNLYNPANQDPLLANGNINAAAGLNTYTAPGNGLVICGTGGIPAGCQNANTALNFAPRFGFAYDPTGAGKTVIRGGYGLFFESGNGNEAQTEGGEGNPPVSLSPSGFNILGYSNIVPGAIGPTGYTAIPYNQGWPYVQQYNLNVQHQLGTNDLLEVAYVGSLGRKLARNRVISPVPLNPGIMNVPALAGANAVGSSGYTADGSGLGLSTSCDAAGNCPVQGLLINQIEPSTFFQPYAGYNNIQMKENTAVSSYNALQISLRHSFSHGLTLQAAYTWSHAIDDSSSTYQQTSGGIDNFNLTRFKATSDLNRAQVLQVNYIYEIPLFKNSTSALVKGGLGGWEISGISSFFTGQPVDFNCGVTGFGNGVGSAATRCNTVGPVQIDKTVANEPSYGPTLRWYNPSNVTQPLASQLLANGEPGMFGYMGRNILTGPGRINTDMALLKNIELPWFAGEHSTLQFRVETFNTFNHTQFQYINNGCNGNTPFGTQCGQGNGNDSNGFVNSAWAPRIMQFGLKFIF